MVNYSNNNVLPESVSGLERHLSRVLLDFDIRLEFCVTLSEQLREERRAEYPCKVKIYRTGRN